jgi:hypothetical protein
MAFSENQKNQRGQGPDVVKALKDSLIQDPRIQHMRLRAAPGSAFDRDQAAPEVPAGQCSAKLDPQESGSQLDHFHDESPSIAPVNAPCKLLPVETGPLRRDGIVRDERSFDLKPTSPLPREPENSEKRSSIRSRRTFLLSGAIVVLAIFGIVCTVVSLGDGKNEGIVKASQVLSTSPASLARTIPSQERSTSPTTVSDPPEAPAANGAVSPELQNKLDTMASALADMRLLVEQFTTRVNQMTTDIATLQTAEQNNSQRIAALSHGRRSYHRSVGP